LKQPDQVLKGPPEIENLEKPRIISFSKTHKLQPSTEYAPPEALHFIIKQLRGRKFMLDCGHKVTFGHFLGNNIIIYNGVNPKIICTDCGY